MLIRKGLKSFLVISLILSGCAGDPVKVENIDFYGDKGKYGATKVESLHPEKPGVKILKSEWDALRIGMVCTEAKNVTNIQLIIDTLCAKNPMACSYAKEGVEQIRGVLSQMKKAAVQ